LKIEIKEKRRERTEQKEQSLLERKRGGAPPWLRLWEGSEVQVGTDGTKEPKEARGSPPTRKEV